MANEIEIDVKPSRRSEQNVEKLFDNVEVDVNLKKAKKQTEKYAKETEKEVAEGLERAFKSASDSSKGLFDNIKKGLPSLDSITGGLIGGGVAGLVTSGIDLLGQGITAAFEFSQEISKLQNNISNLTNLSGKDLDDFTARLKATADTFGEDSEEVFKSAQKLAAQTGEPINQVLDNIQKGFISGANASGELLAVAQEYGNVIKEVGGDSEDLIKIQQRAEQQGVFGDKGIDVVKEFGLRIRELPKSTADALNAIGLDSAEISKRLESGQASVLDILGETTQRLSELPPQSQIVGTAIADIFGGPGEDAGLQFLTSLKDINNETVNWTDSLTEAQKRQQETLKNSEEFNKIFISLFAGLSGSFTDLMNNVKSLALGVFQNLKSFFEPLFASFKEVGTILSDLFTEIFGEAKEGIDIVGTLTDVFGVLLRVALFPLKLALTALVESWKFIFNLYLQGVKIVKDFVAENKILQTVFSAIGDVAGFVGKAIKSLLQTLGLLDDEQLEAPLKDVNEELEKVSENSNKVDINGFINQLKSLNKEGKSSTTEFSQLFTATTEEFAKLNNISTEEATKQLNNLVFGEKGDGGIKGVEKAIKEITYQDLVNQLAKLNLEGKKNTETYKQIVEQALNLRKGNDELKESLEAVNKELDIYYNGIIDITSFDEKDFDVSKFLDKAAKDARENAKKLIIPMKVRVDDFLEYDKEGIILTNEELSNSVRNIGGAYADTYGFINEKILETQSLLSSGESSWEDYGVVLGDVLGESAKLFEENTAAQKALSITQAIVNTAVAITKALDLPFPLNLIQTGVIGAIGAAQVATIAGAEDGVVGITESYNKKPGRTDTIPLMVARGESVVNRSGTQKNAPYLDYINKGGSLDNLFTPLITEAKAQNQRLRSLEQAVLTSKFSETRYNLVIQNKNNSKISGGVRV